MRGERFEPELPQFGGVPEKYEPPKFGTPNVEKPREQREEGQEEVEAQENVGRIDDARGKAMEAYGPEKKTESSESESEAPAKEIDPALFGDFVGAEKDEGGRILLTEKAGEAEETVKKLAEDIRKFKGEKRFSLPSVAKGAPTHTEYNSKVRNFSTRTRIIELDDGRKVFAVYNYPASRVHRFFDGLMKRFAGDKMSKASSSEWKQVFEERSNIPIIKYDDPNVVLMPFLPNVNAHDLFARNKEIVEEGGNFGACQELAKNIDLEGKLDIGKRIISELEAVHGEGKTWGETILPNMIITPEGRPIIVDPETRYKKGVPIAEQKARDLRDILMSVCGALHHSESDDNKSVVYKTIVSSLLDNYSDASVIGELQRVVSKKPTFIQKIFRGSYESARLGISVPEYKKVAEAIKSYRRKQQEK